MHSSRRSKAELMGIVEKVVELYNKGKTCAEIEAELRSEGYDISRESIRRTVKKSKTIASDLKKTMEETKVLIDLIRDKPGTDTAEAAIDFLTTKVFQFTKQVEEVSFRDPQEMARILRSLTLSKTNLIKQRMDYKKVYTRVKQDFLEVLRNLLEKSRPELFRELFDLVSAMEAPEE